MKYLYESCLCFQYIYVLTYYTAELAVCLPVATAYKPLLIPTPPLSKCSPPCQILILWF